MTPDDPRPAAAETTAEWVRRRHVTFFFAALTLLALVSMAGC